MPSYVKTSKKPSWGILDMLEVRERLLVYAKKEGVTVVECNSVALILEMILLQDFYDVWFNAMYLKHILPHK